MDVTLIIKDRDIKYNANNVQSSLEKQRTKLLDSTIEFTATLHKINQVGHCA
jgi:hypothetical protein